MHRAALLILRQQCPALHRFILQTSPCHALHETVNLVENSVCDYIIKLNDAFTKCQTLVLSLITDNRSLRYINGENNRVLRWQVYWHKMALYMFV